MILSKLGIETYKAYNGKEAVNLFEEKMIINNCN